MQRRFLGLILAAALAVAAAACGGAAESSGDGTSPTGPGNDGAQTVPPDGGDGENGGEDQPRVGSIEGVFPSARQNGEDANEGDDVRARDELSTDGSGSIDFSVSESFCIASNSAQLIVVPNQAVLARFNAGIVRCGADESNPDLSWCSGDVCIRPNGTVFAFEVGSDLRIKLFDGTAEVFDEQDGEVLDVVGQCSEMTLVDGQVEDVDGFNSTTGEVRAVTKIAAAIGVAPPSPCGDGTDTGETGEIDTGTTDTGVTDTGATGG